MKILLIKSCNKKTEFDKNKIDKKPKKMKVLLIDNDNKIAESIMMDMQESKYEIDVATDGASGEKMAEDKEYDAVVLDSFVPGIDSFELCKKIKKTGNSARVLMCSTFDSHEDKVMSYLSGADNYLIKSSSIKDIKTKIMHWVKKTSPIYDHSFSLV